MVGWDNQKEKNLKIALRKTINDKGLLENTFNLAKHIDWVSLMNAYCLTLNDTNIAIEKKDIKHLHISVCPPDGSVRVSCPLALNDESLRLSLIKRLPWIKEQQQNFLNQNR